MVRSLVATSGCTRRLRASVTAARASTLGTLGVKSLHNQTNYDDTIFCAFCFRKAVASLTYDESDVT
ncbi:hypothetical protein DPMN_153538 [Dreissena polymorpha]|uniref:Uncharacterized protein n=1 Tax=Dreissena polymorpha TaxID=45954 RepID=A0A9D4FJI7_DREPO|nr:hypothetical protein DPMN_153538 [Dreissena polymorpha]